MQIPICENCGVELTDVLDVQIGWCTDCQMDDAALFRQFHDDDFFEDDE